MTDHTYLRRIEREERDLMTGCACQGEFHVCAPPFTTGGPMTIKLFRVYGMAHGSYFDEEFTSWIEARDYASSIIDGDVDSTIEVVVVEKKERA